MGRYNSGVLGNFSGSVGPIVGSSFKGKPYIRTKGRPVKKRKITAAMAQQRARFKLASDFLKQFKELLPISFPASTSAFTARGAAMKKMLTLAVKGNLPELSIDYSQVDLASGSLGKAMDPAVISTEKGIVTFTWTDNTGTGSAKPGDRAILIVYCKGYDMGAHIISEVQRQATHGVFSLPYFTGQQLHAWITFMNEDGGVADCMYAGIVTVA